MQSDCSTSSDLQPAVSRGTSAGSTETGRVTVVIGSAVGMPCALSQECVQGMNQHKTKKRVLGLEPFHVIYESTIHFRNAIEQTAHLRNDFHRACPGENVLRAMLDELVEGLALFELEDHIETCVQCQARLEQLTRGQGGKTTHKDIPLAAGPSDQSTAGSMAVPR